MPKSKCSMPCIEGKPCTPDEDKCPLPTEAEFLEKFNAMMDKKQYEKAAKYLVAYVMVTKFDVDEFAKKLVEAAKNYKPKSGPSPTAGPKSKRKK